MLNVLGSLGLCLTATHTKSTACEAFKEFRHELIDFIQDQMLIELTKRFQQFR